MRFPATGVPALVLGESSCDNQRPSPRRLRTRCFDHGRDVGFPARCRAAAGRRHVGGHWDDRSVVGAIRRRHRDPCRWFDVRRGRPARGRDRHRQRGRLRPADQRLDHGWPSALATRERRGGSSRRRARVRGGWRGRRPPHRRRRDLRSQHGHIRHRRRDGAAAHAARRRAPGRRAGAHRRRRDGRRRGAGERRNLRSRNLRYAAGGLDGGPACRSDRHPPHRQPGAGGGRQQRQRDTGSGVGRALPPVLE